jgi:hypothetical protein
VTQASPEPDLLAALGRVDPPPPAVLDAAREVLWSAVAQEMLATGPASGQVTGANRSEPAPDRRADRRADCRHVGRADGGSDGRHDGRAGRPPDSGA